MASNADAVIINSKTHGNGDTHLITFNASSQLPLKLTPLNFLSWRSQLMSLLIGYNLQGYIDGTTSCPSQTLHDPTTGSSTAGNSNLAFWRWFWQDNLLLHAILASVSEPVLPLIATSTTASDAWVKIQRLFRSRMRVMQLKEELTLIQRGSQPISDYLNTVKRLADELTVIDTPICIDDIMLYILNGTGVEFRDIATAIRTR